MNTSVLFMFCVALGVLPVAIIDFLSYHELVVFWDFYIKVVALLVGNCGTWNMRL